MAGELKGFSLAGLKQDNPFIQLIQKTLNSYLKTVKQKVESIDIQKVKRPSGVSVVPVDFVLTGQQTLTLLLRADGDVYRAQINGKDYPFTGVLDPDSSDLFGKAIKELARGIIKGQVAYTKKLEKESSSILQPKINATRTPPKNVNQQIKANADEELQLDNEIEKLTAERDALKTKLESA